MEADMDDMSSIAKKIKQNEHASSSDPLNSTTVAGLVDSIDHTNSSASASASININGSFSDLSFHDDDEVDEDGGDYADYDFDYDGNDDNLYEEDEDDYLTIQSQFDNVDLPPGVEATLPWLKDPPPCGSATSDGKIEDANSDLADTKKKATTSLISKNKNQAASASSSSSAVAAESSSSGCMAEKEENGFTQNYSLFKQFDTVEGFSDHHYSRMDISEHQPSKNWAKRIQEEWKILEKNLPDTICVRVCEARMEFLRAIIIGASGTPYHDGLFVFDCLFPPSYPDAPPTVYYYSGGLRLNPNLYECGKVCLSLLGTWSGKQNEMWIPGKSTMLQVLLSIQALILNAKPFFNEPGYETSYVGAEGDRRSKKYNEDVFILSLKTMMYTIRKPPEYFEDFVRGHFQNRAHDILVACKAYADGATVGSVVVKDGVADVSEAEMNGSSEFRATVRKMVNALITTFSKFGSIDCEQFRISE